DYPVPRCLAICRFMIISTQSFLHFPTPTGVHDDTLSLFLDERKIIICVKSLFFLQYNFFTQVFFDYDGRAKN
ncbi:hypothetical protein L9F63_023069, partial [Diploptera punctata]